MPSHELRFDKAQRMDNRNAYELRLDWSRDGEHLGLVSAQITGEQFLGLSRSIDDPTDPFWNGFGKCAAALVADAVAHGEGRTPWEKPGFVVHPSAAEALQRADDERLGAMQEGDVVATFEESV